MNLLCIVIIVVCAAMAISLYRISKEEDSALPDISHLKEMKMHLVCSDDKVQELGDSLVVLLHDDNSVTVQSEGSAISIYDTMNGGAFTGSYNSVFDIVNIQCFYKELDVYDADYWELSKAIDKIRAVQPDVNKTLYVRKDAAVLEESTYGVKRVLRAYLTGELMDRNRFKPFPITVKP